jgi:diphthamide synthase subunit DPH2
MAQKINRSQEIRERLQREHKVSCLTMSQHVEIISEMNESLEGVRRDYQVKEKNSQVAAAYVILSA